MILSDAKFEEQCICMFVVIEWEYNLNLPVLFSIIQKTNTKLYIMKKALVCICPCILVTFSTHFA